MGEGVGVGASAGFAGGNQQGHSLVDYIGDLEGLLSGASADYRNAGALSDMLLGGEGFGKSRRYRQYNPIDPDYGTPPPGPQYPNQSLPEELPWKPTPGGGTGGGGGEGGVEPSVMKAAYTGGEAPVSKQTAPGTAPATATAGGATAGSQPPPAKAGDGGPLGPGQWDGPPPSDNWWYYDRLPSEGPATNPNWNTNEDAPVPGQGLLGDIDSYGEWNDIDNKLAGALDWQSSGNLMDLERQELDRWQKFGNQNDLEAQTEKSIGWQRSGELSDLEQQEKWGYDEYGNPTSLENEVGSSYRGLAGPGQYDATRGSTLEGMVRNPGLSSAERSAMLASQTIPIQSALEAQKLEGDARQAATGNSAGRWGASNALALDAAGQAAQAGRNVQTAAADYMRKDRAEGLSGLGGLQGQIDTRKAQGAQGLSNLSGQQRQAGALSLSGLSNLAGKQRANQQFGIQAGMGLNEQQRAAQAQAAQGVGGLGQRQRANTQWGLGALSDLNKEKTGQGLQRIGLTKDMYDTQLQQGNMSADRLGQLASLVRGTYNNTDSESANVGLSA